MPTLPRPKCVLGLAEIRRGVVWHPTDGAGGSELGGRLGLSKFHYEPVLFINQCSTFYNALKMRLSAAECRLCLYIWLGF